MISTGGVEWQPRWPGNLADVITYNSGGGGSGVPANGLGPVDFQHLSQNQYGREMMALSEGEIGGLVNGLKSVFLDGTALQNSDNTFNFTGVSIAHTTGTNTQGMIPGFTSVENEVAGAASLPVKVSILGGPITRTVSTTGLSALRIKIASPTLKKIATDGTESSVAVQLHLELQSPNYNGGAWFNATDPTYDGKFNDRFVYNCRVNLPAPGPWQVRLTRITADHTSGAPDYIQDETWWDGYTEIQDVMLRYPNTAILAAMVNAKQFPNIPSIHAECYGVKVLVPRNYDAATRTYYTTGAGTTGGVWDGTFGERSSGTIGKKVWTNNPAWLFMDLATNERYGAGNYLSTANVDKFALYNIAQVCDQMVSDGKGGTEPRFTCSIHYQQQEDAIRVLSNLASAFRGMLYSAGGMVVPVQDVDGQPVALFTKANVIGGQFSYQGSARAARHTAVMVSWLDPNAGYVKTIEYVEDVAAIVQFGLQIAQVEHIGCTSQAQAQRFGNALLATERLCTETVSFSAGLDSSVVHPGDLIQISDHDRTQSARAAGRVVDSTTTSVTLDAPVTLVGGKTYLLKCRMPSGAVESKTITSPAGTTLVLTVGSAFSVAPPIHGVWMVHESGVSKMYRIVNIKEMDALTYSITALLHDPAKYSDTVNLTVTGASTITLTAPTVTLVSTKKTLKSRIATVITASWPALPKAIGYQAEYSADGGPWETMRVNGTTGDVIDVVAGVYKVRVVALYPSNRSSLFTEATITVSDPSDLPTTIAAISAIAQETSTVYDTPGTYAWVCPELVTSIELLIVGGGGSGSNGVSNVRGGGGGASGAARRVFVPVTPGVSYSVVVGAGGAAPSGSGAVGNAGADSTFNGSIVALGGLAGAASGDGGAASTSTNPASGSTLTPPTPPAFNSGSDAGAAVSAMTFDSGTTSTGAPGGGGGNKGIGSNPAGKGGNSIDFSGGTRGNTSNSFGPGGGGGASVLASGGNASSTGGDGTAGTLGAGGAGGGCTNAAFGLGGKGGDGYVRIKF